MLLGLCRHGRVGQGALNRYARGPAVPGGPAHPARSIHDILVRLLAAWPCGVAIGYGTLRLPFPLRMGRSSPQFEYGINQCTRFLIFAVVRF